MQSKEELRDVLTTIIGQIGAADQKAAALLTIAGVLVAFPAPSILVPASPTDVPGFSTFCATASAAAFIVSICGALMVLFPRTKNKTDTSSLIYFGDIAAIPQTVYAEAVNGADDTRVRGDLIAQIYINAQIACAKHRHFKMSIAALVVGIGFLAASYAGLAVFDKPQPTNSTPSQQIKTR